MQTRCSFAVFLVGAVLGGLIAGVVVGALILYCAVKKGIINVQAITSDQSEDARSHGETILRLFYI